jgi:hypothetical protein
MRPDRMGAPARVVRPWVPRPPNAAGEVSESPGFVGPDQLGQQLPYPAVDLVPNGTNLIEGLSHRVWQLPVEVVLSAQ